MNKIDFGVPNRQNLKGLFVILLNAIISVIRKGAIPLLAVFFTNQKSTNTQFLLIGGGILMLLLIVHSILYYLNFFFYIQDGEFVLKKGYLNKKTLSIPLERIQNINMKQNMFQQLLKVTAIEIDTAGTVGKELKIHALDLAHAKALSDIVSRVTKENPIDDKTENIGEESAQETILQLDSTELLKVGISRNHLRAAAILLLFANQLYNEINDVFAKQAEEYSRQATEIMGNAGILMITVLVLTFLVISIAYSMIETLLRFYRLKLSRQGLSFQLLSGLFNRRSILIPFKKVQLLSWQTSPLMKLFRIYQVRISQASSAELKTKNIATVPGCYDTHVEDIKEAVFQNKNGNLSEKIKSNKYYLRRLWIRRGWILGLLPGFVFYHEYIYWIFYAIWLVLSAFFSFMTYNKRYYQINDDIIRVGKGMIGTEWVQMEQYKIQAVRINQNIFQKRRKLASIVIYSAAGDINIPYISEDSAKAMYDYLLYKIESSNERWM